MSTQTAGTLPALKYLGAIHEGIPVRNLEASIRFYTEVLGLKLLPRPKLPAPGAWLGDDDNTVQFHLIVTDRDYIPGDRKSTRLNSSHIPLSRMPSSA